MTKKAWEAARSVQWGVAFATATLLAGCGPSSLDRRYDGMLAELSGPRVRPGASEPAVAVGGPTDDGRRLFADSTHLERTALIEAVLARNPDIEAARQSWRAALARLPQTTALEDPMLSYGFAPLSIASDDVRFGQRVALTQRVPFPGKRRLAGEAALAEAEGRRPKRELRRCPARAGADGLQPP